MYFAPQHCLQSRLELHQNYFCLQLFGLIALNREHRSRDLFGGVNKVWYTFKPETS